MSEKKFGCLIYEDQFNRLDKAFDDAALGRIVRTALKVVYRSESNKLSMDHGEWYACNELATSFLRSKDSFDQPSIDGKVGNAFKHAANLSEFEERLSQIEGLSIIDQSQYIQLYKEKHPDKC